MLATMLGTMWATMLGIICWRPRWEVSIDVIPCGKPCAEPGWLQRECACKIKKWIDVAFLWFLRYILLHANQPFSTTSPWHTADRIDFFSMSFSCVSSFFPADSGPVTNLFVLCPENAHSPKAAAQAIAAAADQAADHCKAFPKPFRVGF